MLLTPAAPWILSSSRVVPTVPAFDVVVGKWTSGDVASVWEFSNSDLFYFRGENATGGGNIFAAQFANATADSSGEIGGYRARGTLASPTSAAAGDRLFRLHGQGLGNSTFRWVAGIDVRAATGWSDGTSSYPGELVFMTRTTGGTAPADVVKITQDGYVQGVNGSASNPASSYTGDTDTGMYWVSDGIYFSRDSVAELRIGTNAVQVGSASVIQWGSGDPGSSADVKLNRGAAAVLELKNSTTAQEFRVYGSTTGPIYGSVQNDGTQFLIYETTSGAGGTRLGKTGGKIGFYGTTPIALQTGVAVTAAGVHAACVALGLFTA